jgi:hypothetical protein
MIGKQHFTLLYDHARREAMNSGNIISGRSKTGLRPFNPNRVLKEIRKPQMVKYCNPLTADGKNDDVFPPVHDLETPKTSESLTSLRKSIEMNIAQQEALDAHTKLCIQKVANAAENAFTSY